MKRMIVFSIVLLAAAQIACAASANVGAPTPQPAPTAAPPQVIVVQQPAPQVAQPAQPDVIVIVMLVLCVTGMMIVMMWGVAQLVVRSQRVEQPPYIIQQPPPSPMLTEAEHFRILRAAGMTAEQAMRAVEQARWQQQLPAGR